jgi:hypothetical protein
MTLQQHVRANAISAGAHDDAWKIDPQWNKIVLLGWRGSWEKRFDGLSYGGEHCPELAQHNAAACRQHRLVCEQL